MLIRYLSGHILMTMTERRILLCTLMWIIFLCGASAQWKAYLSYYEPTEIEQTADGKLYVLASGGLFSYNPQDQEVQTYDKTTVLSDCDVSHIAWCKAAKKLVIVYSDYNIDLLSENGNVVNMPAYKNTSMTVDKTIYSVDISGNYAYLSTGFGIVKLNVSDGSFTDTYQIGFRVDYSYTDNNYIYAASSTNGLYRASLSSNLLNPNEWTRTGNYVARPKTMDQDLLAVVDKIKPDGPKYNHFGFLKMHGGKLYSCSDAYRVENDRNLQGCIQVYDGNEWDIYQDDISQTTGVAYVDVGCLEIDPKNSQHVFAGARTGLYEFENGKFVHLYTYDNSPLASTFGNNKDYVSVQALQYDDQGNLWVINSLNSEQNILKFDANKQWTSYVQEPLKGLALLSHPLLDSRGLLWFVNDNYLKPSFYNYNINSNILTPYTSFVNEDGTSLTINYFQCITEDKDRNMWIGTNVGPLMLETSQITADNPILTQVKVPRNDGTNYADYLLSGVDIRAILVDKNNRKWFATNGNGLYLIAADNITTLAHFTKDNSKLLSDNILSLAINDDTGEIFIGTDQGLCSYTGNFSDAGNGMTKDNVWAYPNPVKPDYTGAITITGLENGASVKIVTSNGMLVNEGTANNGEYKWYGINRDGKRVASGIYMVEVATSEGDKGVVCKIAIIN